MLLLRHRGRVQGCMPTSSIPDCRPHSFGHALVPMWSIAGICGAADSMSSSRGTSRRRSAPTDSATALTRMLLVPGGRRRTTAYCVSAS